MVKQNKDNDDKSGEIELTNVEDSVLKYIQDKRAKGEKPLSVEETIAIMQLHVQLQKAKDEKAIDESKRKTQPKDEEVKPQNDREI